MDPRIQIAVDYVWTQRAAGVADGAISAALLQIGWPQDYVTAAFNSIGQPPQPAAVQPTQTNLVDTRHKYTIRAAIADVYRGMKVNWLTYLICVLSMLAVASILVTLIYGILSALHVYDKVAYSGFGGVRFRLIPLICLYLFVIAVSAVVNAMVVNVLALTLRDGLDGHRGKPLATLKEALFRLVRVALTNALVALVALGPFIITTIIMITVTFAATFSGVGGRSSSIAGLIISLLLGLAGFAWALIASLRFALAPYVALIEPQTSIFGTLKRSSYLLRKGGQWFLLKGFFLLVAVLIIVLLLTHSSMSASNDTGGTIFTAVNIVVTILINGGLYTLYRNRVAVKK